MGGIKVMAELNLKGQIDTSQTKKGTEEGMVFHRRVRLKKTLRA